MRQISSIADDFPQQLDELLAWDMSTSSDVVVVVAEIIAEVRTRGDEALLAYTKKFDRVSAASVSEFEISHDRLAAAWAKIDSSAQQALEVAASRIRQFHEKQVEASWSFTDDLGNQLGQRISPIGGWRLCAGWSSSLSFQRINDVGASKSGRGRRGCGHCAHARWRS